MGSVKNQIVHPDLKAEREKASFDTEELKTFLMGGKARRQEIQELKELFQSDPKLASTHKWFDMTREEQMEFGYKRAERLAQIDRKRFYTDFEPTTDFSYMWLMQGQPANGLHYTMFMKSVKTFSDDEQQRTWMPLVKNQNINGCYAQTELGHGSNVAGLETEAVFDKATDEFVLNTPTITSTKFWPGDLGLHSTHALVFAQLKIEGKKFGVQPFIVQIRSLKDHSHIEGVESGDIGTKVGYQSKENGWMTLKNVRIPRRNMLMRFCTVDKEGNFEIVGDIRVLYSTMLYIRVMLIRTSSSQLFQALTIALRYACVRRQFSTVPNSKQERRLIEYQTHQYKLLPILALAFTMKFSSIEVGNTYNQLMTDIDDENFQNLEICHHYSAGFKAFFCDLTHKSLEVIRQSCGGAGFSANSGLVEIVQEYFPQVTFEGDTTIMTQQASRYLMKVAKAVNRGFEAKFPMSYLNNMKDNLKKKCPGNSVEDFQNLDIIQDALAQRASNLVGSTMLKLAKNSQESSKVLQNEKFSQEVAGMTESHFMYLAFIFFKKHIEETVFQDPKIKTQLRNMLAVFGLEQLHLNSVPLFESGYFKRGNYAMVVEALKKQILLMRPQAIPLVESSGLEPISAIGNYYGDIYETQLEWAKTSRLNTGKLPKGFEHMQAVMHHKL